jgi:hypothetical protein
MLRFAFALYCCFLFCSDAQYMQTTIRKDAGIPTATLPRPVNHASTHNFDSHFFATGGTRTVYRGKSLATNDAVVIKKFTTQTPMTASFWQQDVHCSKEAIRLADKFNSLGFSNKPIHFIEPVVQKVTRVGDAKVTLGEQIMVEPYLEGKYTKWNSNSGWFRPKEDGGDMIQAFSHWTYHETQGKLMLVDLQGVRRSDAYVLTDPVCLFHDGSGGITDTGFDGMNAFFYHYTCNRFCRSSWRKINNPKMPKWFQKTDSTTFIGQTTQVPASKQTVLKQEF